MSELVCIIGARKGSRRIPGKNRQPLLGKPLYQWTLEAALAADIFNDIIFSTDDDEIAAGVEAFPVILDRRPPLLAGDDIGMTEVVAYLQDHYQQGAQASSICLLTPCHPFRTARQIRKACQEFALANAPSLITITRFESPPEITLKRNGQILSGMPIKRLLKEEFEPSYYPDGAILVFDAAFFKENKRFFDPAMIGFELCWPFSLDIDYPRDLETARLIAPCLLK